MDNQVIIRTDVISISWDFIGLGTTPISKGQNMSCKLCDSSNGGVLWLEFGVLPKYKGL